ncbi:probable RNA-binding protein EIF1AD [Glossina fuscipes]|uniref:Probable RNA-binding protein EIF1AD n=1 Tax=Glossina fuscipes TaxID=7396 RepID=A0A9C6DYX9_9MUSC|nr:probable RNA-binding protein EIF1AD [Glossina fuscipes]
MKEMILDPKDGQQTVRIIAIREFFKRGDFILVEPIEEGDKVKADICKILTVEHIKEYIKAESNYVKESFDENVEEKFIGPCHLSPNRNRPNILAAFEDESTSSEDDS